MQHKSLQFLMLFAGTVALSHTAVAGETLDRIKERGELIGVMDQAYPPYSFLNDKNEMDGMDVELTKEFARRLGVKVRIETPAWEVTTAGNWRGRWDICICSMTANEQRARSLDFVSHYYSSPAVLVTSTNGTPLTKVADMEGKKIAAQQGGSYEQYLMKNMKVDAYGAGPVTYPFKAVQVMPYGSEDLEYQDLALGAGKRIDGLVSNLVTATERMQKMPGKFKIVGEPLYEDPNWVAIDKNGDQEWRDTVVKIFDEMRKDGTLKKITVKWIGTDISR
ncbi:transporter substrate-binding domain-containing protein [Tolumonas osonensis]|uniref:Polar amino acid transport system substrate-binding protein n=1 Tax=Tolumonas osonensis TaxID=675874 RepID=A0A841GQ72_9GAMM|nr:transporter substrate-binding domain-containing protein [Tolumonas osonensis]MBB6057070.1 polar amino acid transport system substrate-binding protein [Tolumonas osonensis]